MKLIEVDAKDHYDAGFTLGQLTAKMQHAFLQAFKPPQPWEELIQKSMPYLNATKKVFPQYIDEINGLANGAQLPFEKLWVLHCLDEITRKEFVEKCSSIFLRQENGYGYIVGHNEDWSKWTKNYYFLLKRTLDNKTVLELGMAGAICGGTISINSGGIVQAINSLHHTDFQIGTPKQIVARWLSSRLSLEEVKEEFPKIKRAAGYAYNLSQSSKILAIESSAHQYEFYETNKSYTHTNHYMGILRQVEEKYVKGMPSIGRYAHIRSVLSQTTTVDQLKSLLLYQTEGDSSVYRTTETATVASLIFDVSGKKAYVTQENKGKDTSWQELDLDFIKPV